jgi:hypothetical protein
MAEERMKDQAQKPREVGDKALSGVSGGASGPSTRGNSGGGPPHAPIPKDANSGDGDAEFSQD